MLTLKCQWSQKYHYKTAHELPALKEGNVVRVKPNPGHNTSKRCCGQTISKLCECSHLVDAHGRGYQRNQTTLHAKSETMKYDTENKSVTQLPSNEAHSLIKDVQQVLIQKTANWTVRVLPWKQNQKFLKKGRVKQMAQWEMKRECYLPGQESSRNPTDPTTA